MLNVHAEGAKAGAPKGLQQAARPHTGVKHKRIGGDAVAHKRKQKLAHRRGRIDGRILFAPIKIIARHVIHQA